MSRRDAADFSPAAEELIAQLHDIIGEEGWDSPAEIAWLRSGEGEDAPPYATLEELAASGLFTVTTTEVGDYPQVALRFSDAGRAHYRSADPHDSGQDLSLYQPMSAATIARLAEHMIDLPWPREADPPRKVEWRLEGYEGQTNWGILHLAVLGDDADPDTLQQVTPPAVAALDARWGSHHELQASWLGVFQRPARDQRRQSLLKTVATAMQATKILWWRPDDSHRIVMTIREKPEPHLTSLLVTIPGLLWEPDSAVECPTCDSALVRSDGTPPHDIDITATTAALRERVAGGRMREVTGDVPLADMLDLFAAETKYTIVSYLECFDCDRLLFWGLCIRGAPIFQHVDHTQRGRHRWEEVPDRATWTGAASATKPEGGRPTPVHRDSMVRGNAAHANPETADARRLPLSAGGTAPETIIRAITPFGQAPAVPPGLEEAIDSAIDSWHTVNVVDWKGIAEDELADLVRDSCRQLGLPAPDELPDGDSEDALDAMAGVDAWLASVGVRLLMIDQDSDSYLVVPVLTEDLGLLLGLKSGEYSVRRVTDTETSAP